MFTCRGRGTECRKHKKRRGFYTRAQQQLHDMEGHAAATQQHRVTTSHIQHLSDKAVFLNIPVQCEDRVVRQLQ
jgi:hypothetical protein